MRFFTVVGAVLAGCWAVLTCVVTIPAEAAGLPRGTAAQPSRFSLIDQLPSEGGAISFNSIEERRRLATFNAALQEVVREGKLPASVFINDERELRAGTDSELPQPKGSVITRIYLTQWAQTLLGGGADAEVVCRFLVEEVRDGRTISKQGPFFGRVRPDVALKPISQDNPISYQTAARQALEQYAAVRPRHSIVLKN